MFDLFGTLVPPFSRTRHDAVLDECAAATGLSAEVLHRAWTDSYRARIRGEVGDFCAQLERAAAAHSCHLDEEARRFAATRYATFVAHSVVASEQTLTTLEALRARGTRMVLVSNANPDVARAWPASNLAPFFDAAVFSCDVGVGKPDRRIYETALRAAGAPPRQAVFIGDGSDDELSGAEAAGIRAVLFRADIADSYDTDRAHLAAWQGPCIDGLNQLDDELDELTKPERT